MAAPHVVCSAALHDSLAQRNEMEIENHVLAVRSYSYQSVSLALHHHIMMVGHRVKAEVHVDAD